MIPKKEHDWIAQNVLGWKGVWQNKKQKINFVVNVNSIGKMLR